MLDGPPARLWAWSVALALGAAAWVPYAPLWGPLGRDDVLPLVAGSMAGVALLFRPLPQKVPLAGLLGALVLLGLWSNALSGFETGVVELARGPGRALYAVVLVLGLRALCQVVPARDLVRMFGVCAVVTAVVSLALYAADYTGLYGEGVFRTSIATPVNWVDRGRLVGTFNLPSGRGMNGLAAYLALFLPLSVALAITATGAVRAAWLAGSGLQALAAILTSTRATPLALAIGAAAALLVLRRATAWAPALPRWAGATGVAALVAGVVVAGPALGERFIGAGTNRPALAYAALRLGAESPWVGHGDIHYNTYLAARVDAMHTPYGVATTTPHNSLALGWFRYGVLGPLLTASILLGAPLWLARRAVLCRGDARVLALGGLVAFTAFAAQSFSNNLLEVPQVAVHYWSLWALLSAAVDLPAAVSPES